MTKNKYWGTAPAEHTRIKSEIIKKYFVAWASIIGRKSPYVTYCDLFAGKGTHKSGDFCTAVQVMELASEDKRLRENLLIILNDKEEKYYRELSELIDKLQLTGRFSRGIIRLIEDAQDLTEEIQKIMEFGPMFCFLDPYSYRGLSKDLIEMVIGSWGSECLLFFATSAINRNLFKDESTGYLASLFTESGLSELRKQARMSNDKRVDIILKYFMEMCRDCGAKYIRPFQINIRDTNRIGHHLVFLSKHVLGFSIIKDVMAKYSDSINGVPTFIFKDKPGERGMQEELEIGFSPIDNLKRILLTNFTGQQTTIKEIKSELDQQELPFIRKNIVDAIISLEKEGLIIDETEKPRRIGTFGDKRKIKFLK